MYMIFWICLPHMREDMGLCLSEPGLLHLIPPIYQQTT
jgi:hypothetical protein